MNEFSGSRPLAVLTGATGFLGSHIAETLLTAGWSVRASTRPTSDLTWIANLDLEHGTVPLSPARADDPTTAEDREALAAWVSGARTIIHCAGVVSAPDIEGYRRGNVATTRRLLEAAREAGGVESFVLISSLAASGPSEPGRPRLETDTPAPISAYGRAKVEAEALLNQNWPFRTCVLRPPALYGPRDRAFLPLFKAARWGVSARIGNIEELSLVDGRDAANAAVSLAGNTAAHGVYFIDDGHRYSFGDLTRAVGAVWNRSSVTIPVPQGLLEFLRRFLGFFGNSGIPLLAPDRLRDTAQRAWTCDGTRLRAELQTPQARGLHQGFAETFTWMRAEGWL